VALFYGFHWSNGWLSVRHIWTAVSELTFSALALALWTLWAKRRRAHA
jgi:hypothetical protein